MTEIRKTPVKRSPASVQPAEKNTVANQANVPGAPVAPTKRVRKPSNTAKTLAATKSTKAAGALIPVQPEPSSPPSDLRTRLSKAFSRPLDKKLKKATLIRDTFTFPKAEYAQLSQLKKRLTEQGVAVKKNQLVRAGLILLAALDDSNLKSIVGKVPSLD